jgi:DDE superfamily endonuclease
VRGFRERLYGCLTRRGDALFELADAVLCADRPVTDLAHLSLVPECGRGHGGLLDGLNAGRVEFARLRRAVAGLEMPAWPGGGIRLAVDVCGWLRPDAATSPQRLFCHVHGRGRNAGQMIAGWPYSFVALLGPGPSSWTALLDAVRLGPGDDDCAVTAAQLREVVGRLIAAGHWSPGDPLIMIAGDAGYNPARLAFLLADLPVIVVARVRCDRVWYRRAPARAARTAGRPQRHGPPVRCGDPATWDDPGVSGQAAAPRHGPLAVTAWPRVHQKISRASPGWEDWPGREFPLIEGTLIRLAPARPGVQPMWLWASDPDAGLDPGAVAITWQAYLRRFDIEHTFRFLKQQLGWDKPMLRDPAAADRWTWLIIACHAQLRLAIPLVADVRLPWQRPLPAGAMTPGRVRAGFRQARQQAGTPASPPKPSRPGPGRPKGSKNTSKAPRHPAGKTTPKKASTARKKRKHAKRTPGTSARTG